MKDTSLFKQIRAQVSKIPLGKVTTYGEVARSINLKDSRKVGWAIYGNMDKNIPCHRVVNKEGYVAEKFSLGGWVEHKLRLENEGITFINEKQVDLDKHMYRFQ